MEWFLFEKALLEFAKYFPEEKQMKPFFYHSVRVWTFLWNLDYNEEIQIAWLLHDVLEDTDFPEEKIKNLFWENVLNIVKANTKNESLPKIEALEDIVKRCSEYWLNALIVKVSDIYDNFNFYKKQNNLPEIERCKILANFVLKYRKDYDDKIFSYAEEVVNFWK